MNMDERLRWLADRAEIQDLLQRYLHAADRSDVEGVCGCFTEDATAQYEGRERVRGREALIDQIALFRNLASGACAIATHFSGTLVFRRLECDYAETENNVIAFLVDGSTQTVSVRSLRYIDRLVRSDGAWRISQRVHTLDWSSELPASSARSFADRVNEIPPDWPAN